MSKIQRRSREELEALAQQFASGGPVQTGTVPMWVWAVCGVVLAALAAWVFWPEPESQRERVAPAVNEAEQWHQRFEAERERRRRAQQAGGDYLARSAAADNALLNEMSASAQRLADKAEAKPGPASQPKAGSKPEGQAGSPKGETATASASPATPSPGPQASHAAPEPTPSQAAPETAKAAPADTAPPPAAEVAQCRIHVSELSASGKLTYADIARMKGARVDEKNGHVFTPAIPLKGRSVVFDVAPNGCVSIARSTLTR